MDTVVGIWRYPVKSMQGEDVRESPVTRLGLLGDRALALLDCETGKVASAAAPHRFATLLQCRAAYVRPPRALEPLPPIRITVPDGSEIHSDDPEVHRRLSLVVGRQVALRATANRPESLLSRMVVAEPSFWAALLEDYASTGARRPGDVPGESLRGNLAPLHLLTTATLRHLHHLYPEGRFDPRRFRPNLLVSCDGDEFVENRWLGHTVHVGDLDLDVMLPTARCVMTTLAQGELPKDRAILRAAGANRLDFAGLGELPCVGVYAACGDGSVHVGDPVRVAGSEPAGVS